MGTVLTCICQNPKEKDSEQLFLKTPIAPLNKSKAACVIQRQFHSNQGYTEFSNKLIEIIEDNCKRESERDIRVRLINAKAFKEQLGRHQVAKEVLSQFTLKLNSLVYEGKDNIYQLHPLEFSQEGKDDREYYYGGWNIKGKSCGLGTLITKEGSVYKGLFNDGFFNGNGILVNKKGDYYFGNWKNGESNGLGKLWLNGRLQYEGEFVANEKCGEGKEFYEDGSHYHGNFANNEKEGYGRIQFADKSYYEGSFSHSVFEGKGQYLWSDGRKYKGDFKNGQMHGNGVHQWNDGSRYSGFYSNNKKQGHGVYIWQEGKELIGNWSNNEPHGNCIYFANGKKYDTVFRFGKIISAKLINEGSTAFTSPSDNHQIENLEFNKESAMNTDKMFWRKFNIESLVDKKQITDKHICPLCHNLLDEAYQCSQCLKNYCYFCIYNKQDATFKLCLNSCKESHFYPDTALMQEMNSLIVNCSCGEVIKYKDRKFHNHP